MGKKYRHHMLLSLLLIVCLAMFTACGSSDEEASGEDGDIGTITLYSPETPDMTQQLADAFEEEHGGTVHVEYAGTNNLVNQMIAEMDNPQADIWYGGGGIFPFETAVEQGFIEAYTPEAVADWEVEQDGIKFRHEEWMWTGVDVFVLGIAYNPELVDEEDLPETWDDLLDPHWEDELQMPNPAASGTATLLVLSQMTDRGEEAAWEYFDELVEQMIAMPDSGMGPTEAVASGEASIAVGFDFMAYQMQERGETVDFIVPEKTPIMVNPAAIVKNGPNPEGGQLFMEFLLSEKGQELKGDWAHIPIDADVESDSPLSLDQLGDNAMELDLDWVVENYDRIREEWRDRYQ